MDPSSSIFEVNRKPGPKPKPSLDLIHQI
jgi:hypothetical protein